MYMVFDISETKLGGGGVEYDPVNQSVDYLYTGRRKYEVY